MIRLNRLTDYAIVVLGQLAQLREPSESSGAKAGDPTGSRTAAQLAQDTGVPLPTVSKVLMRHICQLAIERDCVRVDLNVLNWNPARSFYTGLGMQETGELGMSITGAALRSLAGPDQPAA